jgi:dethiobiotin synthetase
LLSPLTWKEDITDVARAFGARVLLVAPNRLGVIHHVRSAMRVLESAGLSPLGVVLSTQETEASTSTNAEALRRVLGATCPHIAVLPRTDVTKATITTFGL